MPVQILVPAQIQKCLVSPAPAGSTIASMVVVVVLITGVGARRSSQLLLKRMSAELRYVRVSQCRIFAYLGTTGFGLGSPGIAVGAGSIPRHIHHRLEPPTQVLPTSPS